MMPPKEFRRTRDLVVAGRCALPIAATGGIFAARRAGGQHGDHDTDDDPDQDGRRRHDQRPVRDLPASEIDRGTRYGGHGGAEPEPGGRGNRAGQDRLDQHGPGDLPAGGADGPQPCEFPGALGGRHGEGVGNQEDTDEERDAGESEQDRTERRRVFRAPLGPLGLATDLMGWAVALWLLRSCCQLPEIGGGQVMRRRDAKERPVSPGERRARP
jgi:hypothetical protein